MLVEDAQVALRRQRRLQTALRTSRLPGVKALDSFDFAFQPSIDRTQILSLHQLGFLDRKENVIFLGPRGAVGSTTAPWRTWSFPWWKRNAREHRRSGWRILIMLFEQEVHHRSQIDTYAGRAGWDVPRSTAAPESRSTN